MAELCINGANGLRNKFDTKSGLGLIHLSIETIEAMDLNLWL
jgi:hypothetical protein